MSKISIILIKSMSQIAGCGNADDIGLNKYTGMKQILLITVSAVCAMFINSCTGKDLPSNGFAGSVWMMKTTLNEELGFESYMFSDDMSYTHWLGDDSGHVLYWYDSGYYEVRADYNVIALDYRSTDIVCAYYGNPPVAFNYNRDPEKVFYRQR